MKNRAHIVVVLAAVTILGLASAAFAQTDCKTLVPASPWGPNDQTGATNRVTPAVVKGPQRTRPIVDAISNGFPILPVFSRPRP